MRFASGLQADLRLVPEEQFVFALHHFTGSKDHNVQMRQRALARGLRLSEWGLAADDGPDDGGKTVEGGAVSVTAAARPATVKAKVAQTAAQDRVMVRNEEDLFRKLGLHFVPPELREGIGEIETAEQGELPRLVEAGDLRGAFHNHTTASDGRNTLAEMVAAAEALGWEYLGIADHSKASFQANGLSEERLLAQVKEIQELNASQRFKTHVFAGTECDILADGRLDFPADVLAQLDYTVVSVHNAFAQDEAKMTARVIKAIEQIGRAHV